LTKKTSLHNSKQAARIAKESGTIYNPS